MWVRPVSAASLPRPASWLACHFSYGIGSPSGSNVPCSPSPGSGTSDVAASAALSSLTPGTTYEFRLVAGSAVVDTVPTYRGEGQAFG